MKTEKRIRTDAKIFASRILGIPPEEIPDDDTIVAGFMAGARIERSMVKTAKAITEQDLKKESEIFDELVCDILKPYDVAHSYIGNIVTWHERGRNEVIKAMEEYSIQHNSKLKKENERLNTELSELKAIVKDYRRLIKQLEPQYVMLQHQSMSSSIEGIEQDAFKAGANYEHPIAYNQAIDDVIDKFNPVFKIDPKAQNIIEIAKAFANLYEEIKNIKK